MFKWKRLPRSPLELNAAVIPPSTPVPAESSKSIGAGSAVAVAGFGQAVGRAIKTDAAAGHGPEPEKKVPRP